MSSHPTSADAQPPATTDAAAGVPLTNADPNLRGELRGQSPSIRVAMTETEREGVQFSHVKFWDARNDREELRWTTMTEAVESWADAQFPKPLPEVLTVSASTGGERMPPTELVSAPRAPEGEGMPTVHNHGPEEGDGLACRERTVNGHLVGACMTPVEDLPAMTPLANLIRRSALTVLSSSLASLPKRDDLLESLAGTIAVAVCMNHGLRGAAEQTFAMADGLDTQQQEIERLTKEDDSSYVMLRDALEEHLGEFVADGEESEEHLYVRGIGHVRTMLDEGNAAIADLRHTVELLRSSLSEKDAEPVRYDQVPKGCWVAALAGLTGIPHEEFVPLVPTDDFSLGTEEGTERWRAYHDGVCEVLARHGWMYVRCGANAPRGFAMGIGPSARGVDHSVIVKDGVLWHDPHASRDGVREFREFEMVVRIVASSSPEIQS